MDTDRVAEVSGGEYGGRDPPGGSGVWLPDCVANAVREKLTCAPTDSVAVAVREPKAVGEFVALAPLDTVAVCE